VAILLHGYSYCDPFLQEVSLRMTISTICAALEFLGGERDEAPKFLTGRLGRFARYIVWIFAIVLVYTFSGQASKFIYIDF
jgi:hypothetical protein